MLVRTTAVDYEVDDDDELIVQVAGRDEHGERQTIGVTGTTPYFYIAESRTAPDDDAVTSVDPGYKSYDRVPLKRISVETPDDVSRLAKQYDRHWESDIPYYRRVSIDYNLSGYIRIPDADQCHIDEIDRDVEITEVIEPRILIADIEVLQTTETTFEEMMEEYDCPVSHITIWDSFEDEYICLHLDPEGQVEGESIRGYLEGHDGAESLSTELARGITLKRYESEESLLCGFIELFEERRPDLTSGWNWVDFDWDYLLNRMEQLDINEHRLSDIGYINGYKLESKVDCVPAFDMMDAYKKMTQPFEGKKRSYALDYIGSSEIGVGKIPDINITAEYERDRSRLVAYNIMDVMLCVGLDRQRGLHEFFYELAELSQIPIYDTFSEMRLVDGYIMSNASDEEILPPQTEKDIPDNAGGLVLNPTSGVHEWVGVIDLKSLYPSCIITWNISPETIIWDEETTNGPPRTPGGLLSIPWLPDADHADGGDFGFGDIDFGVMYSDMSNEGLIPRHIKRLFPERDRYKALRDEHEPGEIEYSVWDNKQYAVKVIMNSFYGVMSNDYWRLGMHGLGDAVTSTARYALWQGKEIATGNVDVHNVDYETLYGDTDSIMVSLADEDGSKQEAISQGFRLESIINDHIDICVEESGLEGEHPHLDDELHGTDRHCLTWEFEKLYRRFFQAGKNKRYAGLTVWKEGKDVESDIDVTGFESQRSDSPELTEEVQPEVIHRILDGAGFDGISDYLRSLVEEIEAGERDMYQIGLPITVNQSLDAYGNTPPARACRFSNRHLDRGFSEGDDPWMYYVDGVPPMTPNTDVIALSWGEAIPDGYELNYEKHYERAIEGPLRPILDEMGWQFIELKEGARTQSASDWSGEWDEPDSDDEDRWGW